LSQFDAFVIVSVFPFHPAPTFATHILVDLPPLDQTDSGKLSRSLMNFVFHLTGSNCLAVAQAKETPDISGIHK